ncbi:Transmembrane_domain-containing protein [Hexamita inflata]|uniref:Transmembrane domain-containing protein n=1 Tax=Hexamita inflata TaxID=28002 RepID=A0AA86NN60_9EUKA|nr:Transmembrane domain-containing protein [Hexamita inflata]
MKPTYPSLGDMATSPLVSYKMFFFMRTISLIAHIVVLIFGIYTRKGRFFIQFTNWTNMLSTVYSVLAFLTSYFFTMPKFYSDASLTKVYNRTRPSKLAYVTQQLLRLTVPMHFIVSSVFWPLVFPTATRDHGNYDLIYFVFSHGLTLFLLLIESFFSQVVFNRSIIPVQSLYITTYATVVGPRNAFLNQEEE